MSKNIVSSGNISLQPEILVNISSDLLISGNTTTNILNSSAIQGTPPINVISTTLVENLYVAHAAYADTANAFTQYNTINVANVTYESIISATANISVYYPTLTSITDGNIALAADANLAYYPSIGVLNAPTVRSGGNAVITITTPIDSTGDVILSGTFSNIVGSLQNVNSNVGTFGSSTTIPVIQVNNKGLITDITTVTAAGGGGNVISGIIYVVPFSTTPIFDANIGQIFNLTLTGNVTSSTFINGVSGIFVFRIIQDSSGNHTFTWPTNMRGTGPINMGANARSIQAFAIDADGSLDAIGPVL